jgi:hypothetical protein
MQLTMADFLVRRLRDVEPLRAEWVALARRYVAIRGSVYRAENLIPDQAKGYTAACVDAIIRVANDIWAMLVIMGDRDADLRHDDPQLAGAEGLLSAAGARDEDHGTPDPRDVFLPRGVILPRDRWVEIGGRWKHIRDESSAARMALSQFVRKSSRVLRAADRINGSVTMARAHLETMVHAQHPDWHDAGKVFFGTTPPRTNGD